MFVQVIQGHVDDPAPLRAAMEQWVRDGVARGSGLARARPAA